MYVDSFRIKTLKLKKKKKEGKPALFRVKPYGDSYEKGKLPRHRLAGVS
jgi:hypothetical protein